MSDPQRAPRAKRLSGWWYICIGLGFILLGFRNLIAGITGWPVVLRWVIALGFLLLGVGTLRSKR
ncbi:MAG: hypothetical protein JO307_06345 [Bryobacterales bacterium]|nr:hypothetical protein [Bryobacterales bacterium]